MEGAKLAAAEEVKAEKDALRRSMNERRMALSADERARLSDAVCRRAGEVLEDARCVALFAAIRNEVDLSALDRSLRARGVTVAYPRVDPPARLTFHAADRLVPTGRYQIPEPPPDSPEVAAQTLDAIVVPGLAFDRDGYRVGWGAGYYDALLPRAPSARRIGVCFDFQLVPACPRSPGDQPVHVVVTDRTTAFVKEGTP